MSGEIGNRVAVMVATLGATVFIALDIYSVWIGDAGSAVIATAAAALAILFLAASIFGDPDK